MKGFEFQINNEEPIVAASDSLVSLILDIYPTSENRYCNISGMDSRLHHLSWFKEKLSVGDKIKVRIVETDKVSPIIEKIPLDREELKKRYYALKKELEDKGLL